MPGFPRIADMWRIVFCKIIKFNYIDRNHHFLNFRQRQQNSLKIIKIHLLKEWSLPKELRPDTKLVYLLANTKMGHVEKADKNLAFYL